MIIAVARLGVKPRGDMRPPAPGQKVLDAQEPDAGRPFPTAVATQFVTPIAELRPPAPGHHADDAH